MKLSKLKILGIAVVVALLLLPLTSISKQTDDSTITLTDTNTLVMDQAMMPDSVAKLVAKAKDLDGSLSKGKPLYVVLNTPGGSIQSGLEMFDVLNALGRPVHTVTLFAASMGFQTVQNLGNRYITKNGVLMSHRAAGGFEGSFGGTRPSQIDSRYALWLSRVDSLDQQTVLRSKGKQTLSSYQQQYANEMWLTGEQAVAQGYADKVVNVKCDKTLSGTNSNSVQTLFGGTINYETDKCPLNTGPLNVRVNIDTTRGLVPMDQFIREGGQFGPSCLSAAAVSKDLLCAKDTTLSLQRIEEIKNSFKDTFEKNRNHVVDAF